MPSIEASKKNGTCGKFGGQYGKETGILGILKFQQQYGQKCEFVGGKVISKNPKILRRFWGVGFGGKLEGFFCDIDIGMRFNNFDGFN